MKVRDSGMPDEMLWESFFDAREIVRSLGLDRINDIVDIGCGYGTFTIAAAEACRGSVVALDAEPEMIERVRARCRTAGVNNVIAEVRDVVAHGTGLPTASMDAVLLFNILHHDDPVALLREAYRTLRRGGLAAVIHWNHDPSTPRGPDLEIRPRLDQCIEWAVAAGFAFYGCSFDFKPYHYGILFSKN